MRAMGSLGLSHRPTSAPELRVRPQAERPSATWGHTIKSIMEVIEVVNVAYVGPNVSRTYSGPLGAPSGVGNRKWPCVLLRFRFRFAA